MSDGPAFEFGRLTEFWVTESSPSDYGSDDEVLLRGEVTLLLDEDEVSLKPFDAVIQRGTNHVWINKGTETAELVGILVDAKAR